jgi:Lrp/AsnC family transcriptional regulator, leucine-responsive regulatory protein
MLDNTDISILDELAQNSRITMKELGEKIHMTGQATSIRVAKLEDSGVIEGYTIKANQTKLGYPVHAMINIVHTKIQNHQPYLDFIEKNYKYVIHNYKISGDGCYLLECRFPSNEILDEFVTKLNKYVNYKVTIILNDAKKNRQCL